MTGTAPGTLDSGAVQMLGRRDRIVYAALALSRPAAVTQDQLAEALWPDGPPASSAKLVQGCVSRLRARFGSDVITTHDTGYALSRHALTDADRFEQGVARGRDLLGLGQADRAAFLLDERLGEWAGPPYSELDRWPPAEAENTRLVELKLQAEELLVDALLQAGDVSRAAVRSRALAEQEPLRERRWAQLALAEYRLGHQAAALDALRACREYLAAELGIDPSPEVAELEIDILRQHPALVGGVRQEAAGPEDDCPWPGLSAYGPDDGDSFFGRDDDIVAALSVLSSRGSLAVVGPSGIGKSSFVRAGIIPSLQAQGRSVRLLTPTAYALAAPSDGSSTGEQHGIRGEGAEVLVIDQAEELFTLAPQQLAALLGAVDEHRGPRVIALRADRMTEVAEHPNLARLVEQGIFLLGGLSRAGLTAAVEKPAAQRGLLVEPGLVDLLLRDLEGEPAALPQFSHALAQTWSRREGRTLTVEGYRETGGVRGAVAQSAERIYAATPEGDRNALRSLLLRLLSSGSEGEPHRVHIPAAQVTDAGHAQLVDALVQARLVTREADSLTLTHEALVEGWPRLREWLDEDVEGRRVFHHLAAASRAWDELGRPDSELYRGVRLARALAWAETEDLALSETESEFLGSGQRLADAEAAALAARVRRQKRTNRVLAVVVVVALAAGGLALLQARRANHQALAATASAVGAKALKTDDPQLSLLLAAAAQQVSPTVETMRSLSAAIAARPLLSHVRSIPGTFNLELVAANRTAVFVNDDDHVLRAFDTRLRPIGTYDAGNGHISIVSPPLAASDHVVATAGPPGDARPIRLLDAGTLTELPTRLVDTPRNVYIRSLGLSADERRVAAVYVPVTSHQPITMDADTRMRVWDVATGRPAGPEVKLGGPNIGVALSDDASTVFTTSPVAAYDVATGVAKWKTDDLTWNDAIQVHGKVLATANAFSGETAGVRLYDTTTGGELMFLNGDLGGVDYIGMTGDGGQVAASGANGKVIVWDATTGLAQQTLDTGASPAAGVAFSGLGGRLYVAKPVQTQMQVWNLVDSEGFVEELPFDQLPGYTNATIELSQDGTRVAAEGWVGASPGVQTFTMLDMANNHFYDLPFVGKERGSGPTAGAGRAPAGAWSPSGDRFAAGYDSGWVQVVDADAGLEIHRRHVSDDGIVALGYLGEDRLAAATDAGKVVLLDAATLQPVNLPVQLPEGVADMAGFSDGHSAIVLGAGADPKVTEKIDARTWYRVDFFAGRAVQSGRLAMRQGQSLALAPDERHVAFGGDNGLLEIVDLRSGLPIRPAVSDGAGGIDHLDYNDAGDRLAAGSDARPVGLWDARTGTPLAGTFLPRGVGNHAVAFGPDGRIVVATVDGPVFAWDFSARAAIRYACGVAGRDLTRQEWADAFGTNAPYRQICPTAS